jgi:hypothetical protein
MKLVISPEVVTRLYIVISIVIIITARFWLGFGLLSAVCLGLASGAWLFDVVKVNNQLLIRQRTMEFIQGELSPEQVVSWVKENKLYEFTADSTGLYGFFSVYITLAILLFHLLPNWLGILASIFLPLIPAYFASQKLMKRRDLHRELAMQEVRSSDKEACKTALNIMNDERERFLKKQAMEIEARDKFMSQYGSLFIKDKNSMTSMTSMEWGKSRHICPNICVSCGLQFVPTTFSWITLSGREHLGHGSYLEYKISLPRCDRCAAGTPSPEGYGRPTPVARGRDHIDNVHVNFITEYKKLN